MLAPWGDGGGWCTSVGILSCQSEVLCKTSKQQCYRSTAGRGIICKEGHMI